MSFTPALEKDASHHIEVADKSPTDDQTPNQAHDLTYDNEDEEPALHARTYCALLALFMLNIVQVVALTGPPAVVSHHPQYVFQLIPARLHRQGNRWHRRPGVGPQRSLSHASCRRPSDCEAQTGQRADSVLRQ